MQWYCVHDSIRKVYAWKRFGIYFRELHGHLKILIADYDKQTRCCYEIAMNFCLV